MSSAAGCTVKTGAGIVLCVASAGGQAYFVAPEHEVEATDPAAIVTPCEDFNGAPAAAQGGGASFTVDDTFTPTSTNAQSGKAVQEAIAPLQGKTTYVSINWQYGQTQLGYSAQAYGLNSTSVGCKSFAKQYSAALGYHARANLQTSVAIGALAITNDIGTGVIATHSTSDPTSAENLQTNLYLVAAGSALATKYEGGEACLGYVVKDKDGNISACGTRKLSELLTNNTAFAPAMLDLDAPAPTPFLPTGITEPIPEPEAEEPLS